MVSRRELYLLIKKKISASGADSPDFAAKCIFEKCFDMPFPRIMMDGELAVPEKTVDILTQMAEKRCGGYPLQYILGEWEFFGYTFKVGEGVLIPRPDTETLVEQVLEICRRKKLANPVIMDLCSGSGCIAITLKKELPHAKVWATELSERAVPYIRENAKLNDAEINILKADVLDESTARRFENLDIIVSNPPYLTHEDMMMLQREVEFEPQMALAGGTDGLDFYREITGRWKNSLKSGGVIAFEFGMNQHEAVSRIMEENGFINIQLSRDTAGIIRTAAAEWR
jgi:release factor glutamine methyltransferase